MRTRDPRARDILKLITAKKPSRRGALDRVAERRIDLRRQPPRGAARKAQQLGLAPGRGQRPARRLANHRRIVAVGDDQPGSLGK